MSRRSSLVVLYTAFALAATLANLGSQALVVAVWPAALGIELSILVGTGVGLVIKYVLDKRYIFRFKTRNLLHDGRLFMLYTCMGILTTLLFWATEYAFHWLFASDAMRYLGGAIGLAVGYLVKYRLDKRYVFVAPHATAESVLKRLQL